MAMVAVSAVAVNAEETTVTWDGFWNAATNPCDDSEVPFMTGSITVGIAESVTPEGRPVVTVSTDWDLAADDYSFTLDTTALFNRTKDQYQVRGERYVYRNGVLEYVDWRVQVDVFVEDGEPISVAGGGGTALCAGEGPPLPPR